MYVEEALGALDVPRRLVESFVGIDAETAKGLFADNLYNGADERYQRTTADKIYDLWQERKFNKAGIGKNVTNVGAWYDASVNVRETSTRAALWEMVGTSARTCAR